MSDLYGGKFQSELPFGALNEGSRIRDFTVRKVDKVFEEIFTHQKYAAKHPQKWMGRLVSAILESVGGFDIRSEFKKSEWRDVPDILKSMPLPDMSYILLCGHVHTYGLKIEKAEGICPYCSFKSVFPEIDLSDIEINIQQEPKYEITADVTNGWVRQDKGREQSKLGIEGVKFNRFVFDLPTYKHAEQNEKYFAPSKIAEFNMRIAQSALKKVCPITRDENGHIHEGEELDADNMAMFRQSILLDLDGLDKQNIRRAFNESNIVKMVVQRECLRCDEDLSVTIETSNLYPLV